MRLFMRLSNAHYLIAFAMASLLLSLCVQADSANRSVLTFATSDSEPPLSSQLNNKAEGLIPDIITLIFDEITDFDAEIKSLPWGRAQKSVELGMMDGLLTYPSSKRKNYAVFSRNSAYAQNYGYLVYHKKSPKKTTIESAESFEDLKDLLVITQAGAEWEEDNIPNFLISVEADSLETMFHYLILRKYGDFLVMSPEQAFYTAQKLGYENKIAYRKVGFIDDALIPFYIGIRKSHPLADSIISKVDQVLSSASYKKRFAQLIERYR